MHRRKQALLRELMATAEWWFYLEGVEALDRAITKAIRKLRRKP